MKYIKLCNVLAIIFIILILLIQVLHPGKSLLMFGMIGLIILTYIICPWLFYICEKRKYNNGICPKCGNPLRYFDTASDDSDGYVCDNCHYSIWIAWFKPKKDSK